MGLARARPEYLRLGKNRDAKTSFSAAGTRNIWWVAVDFAYTPNFWSLVNVELRDRIMSTRGGTKRLAILFENCLEIPVSRVLIASVAAQDDFMKRIRRNRGARDLLAPKGIAILYSEADRELMHQLGLAFGKREFLSYRPKNDEEARLLRRSKHID